jgi:hypothetical protein
MGAEIGSYAAGYQMFFQGLFLAPSTVVQAVKTSILAAKVFETLGYDVHPTFDAPRSDIIQAIRFGAPEPLISFCRAIQRRRQWSARRSRSLGHARLSGQDIMARVPSSPALRSNERRTPLASRTRICRARYLRARASRWRARCAL